MPSRKQLQELAQEIYGYKCRRKVPMKLTNLMYNKLPIYLIIYLLFYLFIYLFINLFIWFNLPLTGAMDASLHTDKQEVSKRTQFLEINNFQELYQEHFTLFLRK